jgi:hypothetical protein
VFRVFDVMVGNYGRHGSLHCGWALNTASHAAPYLPSSQWQSGVEYTVGATLQRDDGFVARCQLRRRIAANVAKLRELLCRNYDGLTRPKALLTPPALARSTTDAFDKRAYKNSHPCTLQARRS